MNYQLKSILFFAGAVLCTTLTFAGEPSARSSEAQDARVSNVGGVTVKVTPVNLTANAKTWDFAVVLDTHSADLNDDLMTSAVLLDGAGGRHAPLAWEGAAPGGHHREGVLRFRSISPRQKSIELRIARAGEVEPRSFRWQLN